MKARLTVGGSLLVFLLVVFLVSRASSPTVSPEQRFLKAEQRLLQLLYFALRSGQLAVADLMLEQGASISSVNRYGKPPFVAALERNDGDLLDYVLKRGPDCDHTRVLSEDSGPPESRRFEGLLPIRTTPLAFARTLKNTKLIALIENVAGNSPYLRRSDLVQAAVWGGDAAERKRLIKLDYPMAYQSRYGNVGRPLHDAASLGHAEVCRVLIEESGCDPNEQFESRWSAVDHAIQSGLVDTLEALLSLGGVLRGKQRRVAGRPYRETPLLQAVQTNADMVRYLNRLE